MNYFNWQYLLREYCSAHNLHSMTYFEGETLGKYRLTGMEFGWNIIYVCRIWNVVRARKAHSNIKKTIRHFRHIRSSRPLSHHIFDNQINVFMDFLSKTNGSDVSLFQRGYF